MCNTLSAVSNQVLSFFGAAANGAVNFSKQTVNAGGQFVSSIPPRFSDLMAKIQSIDVGAVLKNLWTVLTSNVGLSAILLTSSVGLLVWGRYTDDQIQKYAMYALGVVGLALSGLVATRSLNFIKV